MSALWDRVRRIIEAWGEEFQLPADRLTGQITGNQIAPATGSSSGAVSLSDANPADVGDAGTADPGTDGAVSRGDHVHALPATGVSAGTYGDASNIPQITIDAEGRITVAVDVPAAGGGFPDQNANEVFAGPTTGADAPPAFRALVAADIPNLASIYQPLDADLSAIAALSTTSFGRSLLTQADAAATRATIGAGTGNGSVTSVALTAAPSGIFDVSGSPITGSGTLALSMDNQAANTGLMGPSTGSPAAPAFRALVATDIPNLDTAKLTTGELSPARGGTGVDNAGRTLTINVGSVILNASGGDELTIAADGIAIVQAGGGIINTRVPYSNADNYLTTEAGFEYDSTDNLLKVPTLRLAEQSTPSTPASGFGALFFSTGGVPSGVDDAGVVRAMLRNTEGNWTPTVVGSVTPGTFTYDTANTKIQWERIGNKVFFNGRILVTATSVAAAGNVTITGLPITSGANSNNGNILGGAFFVYTNVNLTTNYTLLTGVITGGVTVISLAESGDNVGRLNIQGTQLGAAFEFFITGFYKVD